MPSVGHVFVGLAAARLQVGRRPVGLRPILVLTALATFPDLDILFPAAGPGWSPVWAHRGALHSLTAALVAAVAGVLLLGLRRGRARAFLVAFAAAASHGLLDAVTYGGEGVMLLWPFSEATFVTPWRLLPASPFAQSVLSPRGLILLFVEAVAFAPLLLYACWPRRPPGARSTERSTG